MQLLNMRAVLDPKRMYKRQGQFRVPEYSQIGTIVEAATDFFNARISKKDRKRTFVEETLASEANNRRFKRKYEELQAKKKSGRKAFYKRLMEKRTAKGAV
jgi:seryl-tRNA synthetase